MPDESKKVDIDKINKNLFAAFRLDDKSDAIAGYLYMKYISQFGYRFLGVTGRDVKEPDYQVGSVRREEIEAESQDWPQAG